MLTVSSHPLSPSADQPQLTLFPFPTNSDPIATEAEENERPRLISRETVRARSQRSFSNQSDSQSIYTPLPRHLTFESSPHLLDPAILAALPPGHLQALVIALARDLSSSKEEAGRLKRINGTLMNILLEKGAMGEQELERVKRRAMVDEDEIIDPKAKWKISLEREIEEGEEIRKPVAPNMAASLDLDDLAEAISENFSYQRRDSQSGSQSDLESEPTLSYNNHPHLMPSKRQPSLSSRLFANFTSPLSAATPLVAEEAQSIISPRSMRSSSVSSVTSSIKSRESRVSKETTDSWIGWKPWRRATSRAEGEPEELEEGSEEEGDLEEYNHSTIKSPSPTRNRITSSNPFTLATLPIVEPALSTPTPVSTLSAPNSASELAPSQTSRAMMERSISNTSVQSVKITSPTHLQAVESAARYWLVRGGEEKVFQNEVKVGIKIKSLVGRLLDNVIGNMDVKNVGRLNPTPLIEQKENTKRRTSLSSLSTSLLLPNPTSPTPTTRSYITSAKGTLGSIGLEPNLTVFPKFSVSRFSIFAAAPALPNSVAPNATALGNISTVKPVATSGNGNLTMELSTIPSEATLASSKDESIAGETGEKPMVDRYGFVYDVRSGMKLLRDSRKRKDSKKDSSGEESEGYDSEEVNRLEVEVGVEAEMEALREALGLPPSAATSPTTSKSSPSLVRSPNSPSTSVKSSIRSQEMNSATPRAPKFVRTTSSASGPKSMKLLLSQLTSMHDTTDSIQKIAWESFIHRRQLKLTKLTSSNETKPKLRKGLDLELAGEEIWNENLIGVAQMGLAGKKGKDDWNEFKELIKKGIPIGFRPKIWSECSGATEAREPGLYQELLREHEGQENQCLTQIDMDCHRTFPTNVFFAGNGPGVAKLRRVLIAYSWRNPTIGYCQGMNNLTATLLLTHPAEEDAFWVLCCIIEKILPAEYFTSHLLVSQADQRVLKDLVYKHLPEVADHFEHLGVELPAVTFSWFLSLFTDALPIQTLLRIWDLLFVFGTVVLFRTAVAIIQMNSVEILACDSAANLYALMRTMTTHLYQVDKLLKIAFDGPTIKDSSIAALRARHVADLSKEMGI